MSAGIRGKKFIYENWNTYTCLPINIHELVVDEGGDELRGTFSEKYYGSGGTSEEQVEIQKCTLEVISEAEEGTWLNMTLGNGRVIKVKLKGEELFYY